MTVEELQEKIELYRNSYYEVMNLSNDFMDFSMFRIICYKAKTKLADKAQKLMNAILQKISKKC